MNKNILEQARVLVARTGSGFVAITSATVTYARPVTTRVRTAHGHARELYHTYEDSLAPKLSIKEQMFFAKRLSFLITAGVPILESLHMLAEQVASRRYARVLKSVIEDVTNGYSLARALARFPHIFGDFGINIIKIGESSGTLAQNLDYLADELKKRHTLKQKIVSAFVYPVVISLATLGITAFLVLYLFPKIMPIFTSLHMKLPLSTRIVIGLSTYLQQWGIVTVIVVTILVTTIVITVKKSERFHYLYDGWILRAPVLGDMIRSYNLANATRTLGLLLRSGVTLAQALPLTADTTKNLVYKKEYQQVSEMVIRGERISERFFLSPLLFPTILSQMIAVGERSGNLSDTLIYLSEMYETEVDEFTKNISSLIEPALMVVMGLIIGFIAVSIITPIYGITQNLHP